MSYKEFPLGKTFNWRMLFGLVCLVIAWFLFLCIPLEYTFEIMLLFYLGIYFLGYGNTKASQKTFFTIGMIILLANIILDVVFYNRIHELSFSLLYYVSINVFHVSFYFIPRLVRTDVKYILLCLLLFFIGYACWVNDLWGISFLIGITIISITMIFDLVYLYFIKI